MVHDFRHDDFAAWVELLDDPLRAQRAYWHLVLSGIDPGAHESAEPDHGAPCVEACMSLDPDSVSGDIDGVAWQVRPEWLAGRHWWRIYVVGHPKVLVRYQENAICAAEALAADEARFRREASAAQ